MTEQEVLSRLRPHISEVTGAEADAIGMEQVLMSDLGAESLDLLDLSFLIEDEFRIRIEADEFTRGAKEKRPGMQIEKDGYLTDEALAELRAALPEIAQEKLAPPLRTTSLPSLLTVSVFVHLIQRKVAAKIATPATGKRPEGLATTDAGPHPNPLPEGEGAGSTSPTKEVRHADA
ncbi:MAG: acyl carrier protein [Tepidisphaerales bacterium]